MKSKVYLLPELLEEAGISRSQLALWEQAKLVRADGTTSDKVPFYTQSALDKVIDIKRLHELGYRIEDIQKIIKKVGLPGSGMPPGKEGKPDRFITVGELADAVGISPRAIKHWEDKGIIEPDMRSQGGFRLYSEGYIFLCQLIKDLQLFGYSLEEIKLLADLLREFLTIRSAPEEGAAAGRVSRLEEMLSQIKNLGSKIDLYKEGIERWEELIKKKRKEISALLNQSKKQLGIMAKKDE